ncbi:MAG: hypothetical protein ACI396_00205 [Acutalibacteraceae bacterium]
MEFSKDTLDNILKEFAESGRLFSNERQFQLELAWKLKECYDIYLEVLDNVKDKKYIDIAVKVGDNEFVAIELKYTCRQKNMLYKISNNGDNNEVQTYAQGAGDIRCYAYLMDVQRLEALTMQNDGVFGLSGAKVVKGYAVIMTNDKYWERSGEGTSYETVALQQGRSIKAGVELGLDIKGYSDKEKIKLSYTYTCDWHDYPLKSTTVEYSTDSGNTKMVDYEKYPFKYMILEIN